MKVRGIRIELEALEQAILELDAVSHCEARVVNEELSLLVSLREGDAIHRNADVEGQLKAKALSLGRGYMLSRVKLVRDADWKFNTSGKLLRNVVPLDP